MSWNEAQQINLDAIPVPPAGEAIRASIDAIRKEAVDKYKAEQEEKERNAIAVVDDRRDSYRTAIQPLEIPRQMEVGTYQTGPTIIQTGRAATMSSREIAELTGKAHGHVLRDIDDMLEALGIPEEGFIQNWIDPQNRQEYRGMALPKDLTITLVSGYKVTMRHRIVTRWMELEESQVAKPPAPVAASNDPLDMLMIQAQMFPRLIAEMQEQRKATEEQRRVSEGQARALEAQEATRPRYLETSKSVSWLYSKRLHPSPESHKPLDSLRFI